MEQSIALQAKDGCNVPGCAFGIPLTHFEPVLSTAQDTGFLEAPP